MAAVNVPEFSRPVRLDALGDGPHAIEVRAEAAECAALARRFAVRAIERLEATVTLARAGAGVTAEGMLTASVVQACVATDADVAGAIAEPFRLRFVPEAPAVEADEVELSEGELDEVGYGGGAIDLGEAVAQTLALALDPFPRAADADAKLQEAGVLGEDDARPSTALEGLRDLLRR